MEMAQTLEQNLQGMIGQLVMQVAQLTTTVQMLTDELSRLKELKDKKE